MQIHDTQQGSAEWLALRARHFTASEAPAMMGASQYMSRSALLQQKHSGIEPELDAATERLFAAGRAAEAARRPAAEAIVGDELFPAVGTLEVDGLPLLASFDGITLDGGTIYEHKLANAHAAEHVRSTGEPPMAHVWQIEHQLLVSGASVALYELSDGGEPAAFCWYRSRPERRAALIAGWRQFAADLAAYTPTAPAGPVVAAPVETLPALSLRVDGALAVVSNLDLFGEHLRRFVAGLPKQPSTDQEFANAEAACKVLQRAQDALEQAESAALAQTASIEQMRRMVADYVEIARSTRLLLERVVKQRKEQLRAEIVARAQQALAEHIERLNARLGRPYMPTVPADFGTAIKGKKTLDSIRSAVDQVLAHAKIAANERHAAIEANMATLRGHAEHAFLFADEAQLVLKLPDDLSAVVQQRIAAHAAAEAKRIEAERARIRAEEEAKAKRIEAKRIETEQHTAGLAAPAAAQVVAPIAPPVATPAAATVRGLISLRDLSAAIGLPLTAESLAALGHMPATVVGNAAQYHEASVPDICDTLCRRLALVREAWLRGRAAVEPATAEVA